MNEIQVIFRELQGVLEQISVTDIHQFGKVIGSATRIFVTGEGRSGLMAKAFAMRLMHLGATAYVVGETITPAMRSDDVLIAISGSGTTETVNLVAGKAKALGCHVIAVTANTESPLASQAAQTFRVPGATKYRRDGEPKSVQLLSSLFDQSLHLFLDAVCLHAANAAKKDESTVLSKHSNLE
jgi:6-phospho-3-hexuloisomerase